MTIPAPDDEAQELPADALSTTRLAGRYPGRRHPRTADLVATAVFTALLVAVVVLYVVTAIGRADTYDDVPGTALANGLAIVAPIVLGVFSLVFSSLLILRRVRAFWLPIVAGLLVIALYSVTSDMLDTAVLNGVVPA